MKIRFRESSRLELPDWLVIVGACFVMLFALLRAVGLAAQFETLGVYTCVTWGVYVVFYLFRNRKSRYSATIGRHHAYVQSTHRNGKLIEYEQLKDAHLEDGLLTLTMGNNELYRFDFSEAPPEDLELLSDILSTRAAYIGVDFDPLRHLVE